MDIFFHDPTDLPLPPDEVHIRDFRAQLYPDGRRVRIYLEISPFQKRPSGEITIISPSGNPVANANIIETVDPKLELTMHLRGTPEPGIYSVQVDLFYEVGEETESEGKETPFILPERSPADHATATFEII